MSRHVTRGRRLFVVFTAAGKAKEAMGARETSANPAMGINSWFNNASISDPHTLPDPHPLRQGI